jgi:putative metallohydrolase (TIGR04338 family)
MTADAREQGNVPSTRGPRRPRDAQRRRVYLAETPLPASPLAGLDACARFVDRVVGTFWWHERFPERDLASVPRLRPGQGARQAFYREDDDGPTITLPRRYRTKAVVLHELVHWAFGIDSGLPHHGRTFARALLDAVGEFCSPERGAELAASYRAQGVHVGKPPRRGPDDRLHYGWDERLRLGKGRVLDVSYRDPDGEPRALRARFDGYERGASRLRFLPPVDGHDSALGVAPPPAAIVIPTSAVWAVANVG